MILDICTFTQNPTRSTVLVGAFTSLDAAIDRCLHELEHDDHIAYCWVRPTGTIGKPLPLACITREHVHLAGTIAVGTWLGE